MSTSKHSVYVKGLPYSFLEEDILALLPENAPLEIQIALDPLSGLPKGFAHLVFKEKAAMELATEKLNGMELEGRVLFAEAARGEEF